MSKETNHEEGAMKMHLMPQLGEETPTFTKDFQQVVVWPGTVLREDEYEDFTDFFKTEFDTRVAEIESVTTGPNLDSEGNPVPDTGGRIDVIFKVHNDDIPKFAIPKMHIRASWWEDMLDNGYAKIIPAEVVAKYPKTW